MLLLSFLALAACKSKSEKAGKLEGTWQLLSAKTITGKDTVTSFPVAGQEMIKVINATHFSFFRHDKLKGKGTAAIFDAGGGTYTLKGSDYSEKLDYCTARDWEGHQFDFKIRLTSDSLIQTGTEKIDSLGIDRQIVEVYKRLGT